MVLRADFVPLEVEEQRFFLQVRVSGVQRAWQPALVGHSQVTRAGCHERRLSSSLRE